MTAELSFMKKLCRYFGMKAERQEYAKAVTKTNIIVLQHTYLNFNYR